MPPPELLRRSLQAGQGMTEYIIVFPVMLLLLFGTLQFALLYHAKIQLNYAAFEAAREGALNNAQPWALQAGLVRGLVPLHTHNAGRGWLRWARGKVWGEIDQNRIRIDVINPSPESFDDHGIDAEYFGEQVYMIPNDHLMYRDATVKSNSNQTIQDANLLKIRVLYCYEMHVPFVNRVINGLLRVGSSVSSGRASVGTATMREWQNIGVPGYVAPSGSFENECLNLWQTGAVDEWRRHIPIVAQAIVRMQSPAIQAGN